jgi:hypothetical protein
MSSNPLGVACGGESGEERGRADILHSDVSTTEAVRVVLAEARAKRRNAKLVGAGIVVVFVFVVFSRLNTTVKAQNAAHFLGEAAGAGTIFAVLAYAVQLQRRNTEGVLVWLRRFRQSYGTHIRFHGALGRASRGLVTPITIQDRSFRASNLSTLARGRWFGPLAFFAWALVAALLAAMAGRSWPAGQRAIPEIAVAVTWSCMFAWILTLLVRRAGFTVLTRQGGLDKAARRLAMLASGERWIAGGIEVFKCDDDIWRTVVTDALQSCSVAVLDATEPTDNLLWELGRALHLVGPEGTILTVEEGADIAAVAHAVESADWPDVDRPAPDWVSRSLVTYPAKRALPGRGRRKQMRQLAQRLELEIAARMATRPSVPVGEEAKKRARWTRRRYAITTFFVGGLAAFIIGNRLNVGVQESNWTSQYGEAIRAAFITGCTRERASPQTCECVFTKITSQPAASTAREFERVILESAHDPTSRGRAAVVAAGRACR